MTRENPHLDAALRYARVDWPVFPCAPGDKLPAIPSAHREGDPAHGICTGECGRDGHGFHDATTDRARITGWWEADPRRNVGIATGKPGPDVLDVDTKGERSNGFADWNTVRRAGLIGTPQATVRTPSGGMHAYWRGTDQRSGALRTHGLDYRAQGGYVVAVPSLVGGSRYEVVQTQRSADTCDWQAIRNHLEPQPERPAWQPPVDGRPREVGHLAAWVAGLPEGNGNNGLFWAACRAAEASDAAALEAIGRAAVSIGMTERAVAATIRSAQRTASPKAQPQREAG